MDFDNKFYELLDVSDDLLYLSQIIANVRSADDKNLNFVIVTLNTINKKMKYPCLNWWGIFIAQQVL